MACWKWKYVILLYVYMELFFFTIIPHPLRKPICISCFLYLFTNYYFSLKLKHSKLNVINGSIYERKNFSLAVIDWIKYLLPPTTTSIFLLLILSLENKCLLYITLNVYKFYRFISFYFPHLYYSFRTSSASASMSMCEKLFL